MAAVNTRPRNTVRTHEGGPALPPGKPMFELRRAVSSCLLWEDTFYESGEEIAARIRDLAQKAPAEEVMALATEARTKMGLRHAPLWLTLGLFGRKDVVRGLRATVASVIQRADEMGEMIAMYWKDGKKPLPSSLKRGVADAFGKFDAYQLAKYDRKTDVRLRDVLRMSRPKPANTEQEALWKQLLDGTLPSPDTWEVGLSGGGDKRETFERLLREGKLGYLALLRNLRNMVDSGVERDLIRKAILARKGARYVFPFRYVAAARAAPSLERDLDEALVAAIKDLPKLPGKTVILVDVSGSMDARLSAKSDLTRMDAAAALASLVNAEDLRVFSFSYGLAEVPARRGMAGVDAVIKSQPHGGTALGAAVAKANEICDYDRIIVITDEQSHDSVAGPRPGATGYMINVAGYRPEVGYGDWTRISGFSENVIRYIAEIEGARLATIELEDVQTDD